MSKDLDRDGSASTSQIDLVALEAKLSSFVPPPYANKFERNVVDQSGSVVEIMVTDLILEMHVYSAGWGGGVLDMFSGSSALIGLTDDGRLVARGVITSVQGALDAVEGTQRSELVALLSGDTEEALRYHRLNYREMMLGLGVPEYYIFVDEEGNDTAPD